MIETTMDSATQHRKGSTWALFWMLLGLAVFITASILAATIKGALPGALFVIGTILVLLGVATRWLRR